MHLITDVRVRGFRSIQDDALHELADFSVLAGLNNSGKSNFLRALNLFFNEQVEPGVPFLMSRDFHRSKAKRKKVVRIDVAFNLPPSFSFRNDLKYVETLLGDRDFSIGKEWVVGRSAPYVYLNESRTPLGYSDANTVAVFLNLISFRYIPNRVVPTDVIRAEQDALRGVLNRRLSRNKTQQEKLLKDMRQAAKALTSDLAAEVCAVAPEVVDVRLATPKSLADFAFSFGYRLTENDVEMHDVEQGSGFQSLLMFQTLRLIDLDRYQQFGWKQASIWAVEEPESSLHTSLEAQIARFLKNVSATAASRLQVIATTHSDLMIQHASKGYFVEKGAFGTSAAPMSRKDLLAASARFGVSRWSNPLLMFPLDPVVLVEGKSDRDLIERGLRLLNLAPTARVVCLADLTGREDKGGVETLKTFVKNNADVLEVRLPDAPVTLLLDWDASNKVGELRKPVATNAAFSVMAWNADERNPSHDDTFRGIEMFLTDRLIDVASVEAGGVIAVRADGRRTIPKTDIGKLKEAVAKHVPNMLAVGDLQYIEPTLRRLSQTLERARSHT